MKHILHVILGTSLWIGAVSCATPSAMTPAESLRAKLEQEMHDAEVQEILYDERTGEATVRLFMHDPEGDLVTYRFYVREEDGWRRKPAVGVRAPER